MFVENIDAADFDAGFFNISRADAVSLDPQQRQLLEVVYEGLENAGVSLERLDGAAFGCFVGSYAVGIDAPYPLRLLDLSHIQTRLPGHSDARSRRSCGRYDHWCRSCHFEQSDKPFPEHQGSKVQNLWSWSRSNQSDC
jgi:hypothetical protein